MALFEVQWLTQEISNTCAIIEQGRRTCDHREISFSSIEFQLVFQKIASELRLWAEMHDYHTNCSRRVHWNRSQSLLGVTFRDKYFRKLTKKCCFSRQHMMRCHSEFQSQKVNSDKCFEDVDLRIEISGLDVQESC